MVKKKERIRKRVFFVGMLTVLMNLCLLSDQGYPDTTRPSVHGGTVFVETEPEGAEWFLDGLFQGTTPGQKEGLKTGDRKIIIRKPGFKLWNAVISIRTGKTTLVEARLHVMGPQPGETWRESITGIDFVWVPAGCFQMGSPLDEPGRDPDEGPLHEVCVDGFWMGRTEITNGQFRLFQNDHDSGTYNGRSMNGEDQPAVRVSWTRAKVFAEWMSQKTGWAHMFRLPTEAEWEYACRGGTVEARFWGEDPNKVCGYANVHDYTSERMNGFDWPSHDCDDGFPVTAPVGHFNPNPFGLYDMLGNAWEWCEDRYGKVAYREHRKKNPRYGSSGPFKVNRGGGWSDVPRGVRCAIRERLDPEFGNLYVGFRLIRSP